MSSHFRTYPDISGNIYPEMRFRTLCVLSTEQLSLFSGSAHNTSSQEPHLVHTHTHTRTSRLKVMPSTGSTNEPRTRYDCTGYLGRLRRSASGSPCREQQRLPRISATLCTSSPAGIISVLRGTQPAPWQARIELLHARLAGDGDSLNSRYSSEYAQLIYSSSSTGLPDSMTSPPVAGVGRHWLALNAQECARAGALCMSVHLWRCISGVWQCYWQCIHVATVLA
jgi:hypothetical protein